MTSLAGPQRGVVAAWATWVGEWLLIGTVGGAFSGTWAMGEFWSSLFLALLIKGCLSRVCFVFGIICIYCTLKGLSQFIFMTALLGRAEVSPDPQGEPYSDSHPLGKSNFGDEIPGTLKSRHSSLVALSSNFSPCCRVSNEPGGGASEAELPPPAGSRITASPRKDLEHGEHQGGEAVWPGPSFLPTDPLPGHRNC